MITVLTRFDGAFFIGQMSSEASLRSAMFLNPAVIQHLPVHIQSRIGDQSGLAIQTSIVFLECEVLRLPENVAVTILHNSEMLTKHYLAAFEVYKKSKLTSEQAH